VAATGGLGSALSSVDWGANITQFCANGAIVDGIDKGVMRLAIWSKQFEIIEGKERPAICFIREMQTAGHLAAAAAALGCYKLAASGMRTIVESALYYSYFRVHEAELATLLRDERWYMSKQEILDYHVIHTVGFADLQKKISLSEILNPWYSKLSAVIHGQVPGMWHTQKGIAGIKYEAELAAEVADYFEGATKIVDRLFFSTVGRELWSYFSPTAKKSLLHGMSGELKTVLGLSAA
jgi:hypothetical protein